MRAILFDTETTGIDEPEIIETAMLYVDVAGDAQGAIQCDRWRPAKRIALGAMATHHIMDEDLEGAPASTMFSLPADVAYIIGHNVDFDWRAIGSPDLKRIDTCAMCRSLWPELDSHKQSAMMYHLERASARQFLREAHSAAADVGNLERLLRHIIAKAGPFESFDDMHAASERMRIPKAMPFGKHKGMAIRSLPRDYRAWLLRQEDIDPYLRKAVIAA